jgi:hypothetical protein
VWVHNCLPCRVEVEGGEPVVRPDSRSTIHSQPRPRGMIMATSTVHCGSRASRRRKSRLQWVLVQERDETQEVRDGNMARRETQAGRATRPRGAGRCLAPVRQSLEGVVGVRREHVKCSETVSWADDVDHGRDHMCMQSSPHQLQSVHVQVLSISSHGYWNVACPAVHAGSLVACMNMYRRVRIR